MLFFLFLCINEKRNFRCTLCDYNWCRIFIKILLSINCCGFQLFYCSLKKNTRIQNNFYKRKLAFKNILTILYEDHKFNDQAQAPPQYKEDEKSCKCQNYYDEEFKQNIDLNGLDNILKDFLNFIEQKFK
jgi:hypothetical protein